MKSSLSVGLPYSNAAFSNANQRFWYDSLIKNVYQGYVGKNSLYFNVYGQHVYVLV